MAGHVEAGLGQAAVVGAPCAVACGLVHGALDAGPAGVIGLEADRGYRGAGGGLGFGQVAVERHFGIRLAFQNCHRAAVFCPEATQALAEFTTARAQFLNHSPELTNC